MKQHNIALALAGLAAIAAGAAAQRAHHAATPGTAHTKAGTGIRIERHSPIDHVH